MFASEIEPQCVRLYRANFSWANERPEGIAGDIWNVSDDDVPQHDLLVAGFPCQPFSALGAQQALADTHGDGKRGLLFTQICRILRGMKF
eukprot:SAG31_NODE_59_length_29571_cov_20.443506_32_plen_90_part_00